MKINLCVTDANVTLVRNAYLLYYHSLNELGHSVLLSENHLLPEALNIIFTPLQLTDLPILKTLRENRLRFAIASFEIFCGDSFNHGEFPFSQSHQEVFRECVAEAEFVISHYLDEFPAYRALTAKAFYIPYGFHPRVEEIESAQEKFFDVYFFGSLNPERVKIINALRSAGLAVAVHQNGGNVTARNSYIAASRITLNLVQGAPYTHVSVQRVLYLANNRICCVSNRNADRDNYLRHAVSLDTAALVEGCMTVIRSRTHQRLGEEAYVSFSQNLMTQRFEEMLDTVY
jgi:hypothetical protein